MAKDGTLLSRSRLDIAEAMRVNTFARLEDGRVYFQDSGVRLYRWAPKSGPPVAIADWKYQLRGGYGNRLAVEEWIGGTGRVRLIEAPLE